MDVDDLAGYTLGGEFFSGGERVRRHKAGDEYGQIRALAQGVDLEEVKLIIIAEHARQLLAEQANVHGTVIVVYHGHGRAKLHIVDRLEYHDAGDGAQNADILHAHVRTAVELGGDAGVSADYFDVALRVGYGYRYLVADAAGSEGGEALNVGLEAVACKSGGDGRHVLLRNAAVEHLVGEALIQGACAARLGEVGVEDAHMPVAGHKLRKALGVNSSHFHNLSPPLSRR